METKNEHKMENKLKHKRNIRQTDGGTQDRKLDGTKMKRLKIRRNTRWNTIDGTL